MSPTVSTQNGKAAVTGNTVLRERLTTVESELESTRRELAAAQRELAAAERRIAWFKRELFGSKSEKRLAIDPALQPSLFAGLIEDAPPPPATETVEIQRRKKTRDGAVNDTGLRFDASVPVRVIEVAPPDDLENGEIIAIHSTFRLAQRRASYEILEYRCPVIKASPEAAPQTTPVPGAIFTGSLADVSFLAGMLVDKFGFHIPLYRQHQRLAAGGITLARATLTQLVARSAALLAPIHLAQLEHVLTSRVLAMDETPIKAGHKTKGKLESGYFWPLYGDADEISFTFSPSRGRQHIEDTLAEHFTGTLVTDGYAAYARYAEARPGVTHAQCWAHARRGFERALDSDPQAQHALALIGELYKAEADIRERRLEGSAKLAARTRACEPAVRAFWRWCDNQCQRLDLEPRHP
ncbi:MAG: IS66 family transposase, partial [Salinisphaera sp.]|uniref:IS66 family transposase n=1 Tax=Salinisphaera sp. TaxID=1914330 RepID=UPI003C7D2405